MPTVYPGNISVGQVQTSGKMVVQVRSAVRPPPASSPCLSSCGVVQQQGGGRPFCTQRISKPRPCLQLDFTDMNPEMHRTTFMGRLILPAAYTSPTAPGMAALPDNMTLLIVVGGTSFQVSGGDTLTDQSIYFILNSISPLYTVRRCARTRGEGAGEQGVRGGGVGRLARRARERRKQLPWAHAALLAHGPCCVCRCPTPYLQYPFDRYTLDFRIVASLVNQTDTSSLTVRLRRQRFASFLLPRVLPATWRGQGLPRRAGSAQGGAQLTALCARLRLPPRVLFLLRRTSNGPLIGAQHVS